uniref:Uncharacterized protein n=1 Tax=Hyaloperonospora arabidopsidis (strain Emoy2) TaxID=559515 RepID=M4BRC4_HYAAE
MEIVCRSVTGGNEECMGRMRASPGASSRYNRLERGHSRCFFQSLDVGYSFPNVARALVQVQQQMSDATSSQIRVDFVRRKCTLTPVFL